MSIAHQLSNAGLFVIEDARANRRNYDEPLSLPVSYLEIESIIETIAKAASTYQAPIVLVLETGQVVVLTESGKGGIAVQGKEGELNEVQTNALGIVTEVLTKHFGLEAPKKRSKAKPVVEPVEPETVPEGTDTPDEALDPLEGEIDPNGEASE